MKWKAADETLVEGTAYVTRADRRQGITGAGGAASKPYPDEAGKSWLQLRGRAEKLAVSRLYAHLFKAM